MAERRRRSSVKRARAAMLVGILGALLGAMATAGASETLVELGESWRLFRGERSPSSPSRAWRAIEFDDSDWELATAGVGYGDGDDRTVLDDMEGRYTTVFLRKVFVVDDPSSVTRLDLDVIYDDGFVCWLNGEEVARANAGATGVEPRFDDVADSSHEADDTPERFALTAFRSALVSGENLLAIQGLNRSVDSSDFSLDARLVRDDVSALCLGSFECVRTLRGVLLRWPPVDGVDRVEILRDGVPLPGSPFSGDFGEVLDEVDDGGEWELRAFVDATPCPPLVRSPSPETALVAPSDLWRFAPGRVAPSTPPEAWREPAFDDSGWELGRGGFGYGDGDDRTLLDDMRGEYASVYVRRAFEVDDPEAIRDLVLRVDYDDGVVAWLNGIEVARSSSLGEAGLELSFDDTALDLREAGEVESFDVDPSLLVAGLNVLAVEGHNAAFDSSDFSLAPGLWTEVCEVSGLSCAFEDDVGVALAWNVRGAEQVAVSRDGVPLPGSPFDGATTGTRDVEVGAGEHVYELEALRDGAVCSTTACAVSVPAGVGVSFAEPAPGWAWEWGFAPGSDAWVEEPGVLGCLDGAWLRALDDAWDGSAPLEEGGPPEGPSFGGVGVESLDGGAACDGDGSVLRLLDPGSGGGGGLDNRRIVLAAPLVEGDLLSEGVTLFARWRLHPSAPAELSPGALGDGAPVAAGLGQIGVVTVDGGGALSRSFGFALDSGGRLEASTTPRLERSGIDATTFVELWATARDDDGDGRFEIRSWLGSAETPLAELSAAEVELETPAVDLGSSGSFLVIALASESNDADLQIDRVAVAVGAHAPRSERCTGGANRPPSAHIAVIPGRIVRLESAEARVTLDATASDDGEGGAQGLSYSWVLRSGPGPVEFSAPGSAVTEAYFREEGDHVVELTVDDGQATSSHDTATVTIEVLEPGDFTKFRRGDYDESGELTITDAIAVFDFLFLGGAAAPVCPDAADADDDGELTVTDGVRVLNFLFQGFGVLPPPGPSRCGIDATDDGLGRCESRLCG